MPPPPPPHDIACSGAVDHDGAGSSGASGQEDVVDVNDAAGSDQLDIHSKAPEDCKALSLSLCLSVSVCLCLSVCLSLCLSLSRSLSLSLSLSRFLSFAQFLSPCVPGSDTDTKA